MANLIEFEKKWLRKIEVSGACLDDILVCSLDKAIKTLNKLNDRLKKEGWENLTIEHSWEVLYLSGDRLETDKEFETRKKKELTKWEKGREKRKKQFEKLKEEFGDK